MDLPFGTRFKDTGEYPWIPRPVRRGHARNLAAISVLSFLVIGALAATATGLAISRNQLKEARSQLGSAQSELREAHASIRSDRSRLAADRSQLATDRSRLDYYNKILGTANQNPPADYREFQKRLIASLESSAHHDVSPSAGPVSVECVLPSEWTPGAQFNCDVFGANSSQLGTATITIESTNPGQSTSWEYVWKAVA